MCRNSPTFRSAAPGARALAALAGLLLPLAAVAGEPTHGRSADDLDMEKLLETAEVVRIEDIGEGITKPRRLTLKDGDRQVRAVFKTIDVDSNEISYTTHFETSFSDRYVYEVAAYRLDRLLGLRLVPVTVIRTVDGVRGSAQLWIDDVISMQEAMDHGMAPRDEARLDYNMMLMSVLDGLIHNVDRNFTNILVQPQTDAFHLIDHSRAFRTYKALPRWLEEHDVPLPEDLARRLRALDLETLQATLGDLLHKNQIKPILKRRDLLVENLTERGLMPGSG